MIWKRKLFVVPFFVFVSLLFLVFGFSQNCSATSRQITGFSTDNATFSLLESGVGNNFKFSTTTSDFDNKRSFVFNNPILNLGGNLRSNNQNGIILDFYVFVKNTYSDSSDFLVSPYCPYMETYESYYTIDSCDIDIISYNHFIDKWNVEYQSTSAAYDEIFSDASSDTSYILHFNLVVYKDSDSYVSTRSISLYGRLFSIAHPLVNRINHSTIYILFGNAYDGIPINRKTAEEEMNEKDDEDRANIENQTSDTQDGADESSAQAQATGTTLMGAFSAFVTALASVHETNCNLPSFSIYGMNFNNMNLCTFDVPSGIIALATIGMVFIIVPLSFHLVRRLINIFRSFSG